MKRSYLFILVLVLALAACTEVSFPTHQPKGEKALHEFPQELQGRYITSDTDSIRDTLIIDNLSYHFTSKAKQKEESWLDNAHLSDSLILKKYKGFYFFNFKEKDQWLVRVVKRESTGNLSFRMFAIDGASKDKLFFELEREVPVEVIQISNDEKYYRIDPSPKKLLELVRKKKFWEESVLIRLK